ncbi:MAG: TetR/AcrR family transcriptional regulator [Acetobacteraceae bacterium]|jgi:AcrR family transcriptional regulator
MSDATPSTRDRILEAAFDAFMRFGYSGASTAQIARLARVSKRDLYAHFGSKQAMLAACVSERAGRMRQPLSLPTPTDRKGLHETLIQFGTAVVRELGRPEVLATYRLAIAEAEYAPDVAITLDRLGRATTAEALIALLSAARERGLLSGGEAADMAGLFTSMLTRDGILVRMLMRVAEPPTEAEARQRAEAAAACLFRTYGATGQASAVDGPG